MNLHLAHHRFGFDSLRAALQVPLLWAPAAAMATAQRPSRAGWMERLAEWSDRQPMHHRLGSYTRLR